MKTKKFSKKLVLNKKTIADLNTREMKDVLGGDPPATKKGDTCPWTCPYAHCFPYKTETTCEQCCP